MLSKDIRYNSELKPDSNLVQQTACSRLLTQDKLKTIVRADDDDVADEEEEEREAGAKRGAFFSLRDTGDGDFKFGRCQE
ncbi:hypothetical protein GWI33_005868 [Rhynchophorus ferrugineus]|uniref:Uncharacterized protein n=1 Tax=Rhynchophorus ferrugineus TaxID=354439 RepID=A0A834IGM5_RHYFE|nr:hypothetical protein GWI33_005868 [Rhynchophorus ferrugineus]